MLRLRPYKKCDAKYVSSWIKDEDTFNRWSAGRIKKYPMTAEDLNAHYDEMQELDNCFVMTAYDDKEIVGQLLMRFLDNEKKNLRFGYVIVDDSKRGKGYGKKMLELAIQYATLMLKVEKITIGVFENNMPAYRCYTALGFYEIEDKASYYKIGAQNWKCLELQYNVNMC